MAETSSNPFADFRKQCEILLRNVVNKVFPEAALSTIRLDIPANPQFGELTSSDCFDIAKQLKLSPLEMARKIEKESATEKESFSLIKSVQAAGYC